MTALLRPAEESDIAEVVAIEKICFADPWTEDSFRRLLGGEPAIFLVAVFPPDERVRGYVIGFSIDEDAEVLNVAVEPGSRGKGLAGQMLDAVLIALASRGVANAYLEVRESNKAAMALYESKGFREIGRRERYYRRPVEDALVLRRLLEPVRGNEERTPGSFADR
ncbi:MAG TPA: ribosomal protein S18-alanine N-acetyltransferase [Gemmatimonadaceae bacterium]|nr:ribosomal protein S18-alanine N-acetyltransferase [Gemmatimonadaceae bacterium]